jgi:lipoprotein-releasing system permease protein
MIRTATDFEGIILKGVGNDYDWQYLKGFLLEGALPDVSLEKTSSDILISDDIAARLQLKVGEQAPTYFMNANGQEPIARFFKVSGIYDSGLEEYDSKFIIGDIRNIQRINKWEEDQIGKFEIFIDDFDRLNEIGRAIQLNTPSELNATTIEQELPAIFQWLALLDGNIFGIIGIILIVGIINMITALLVLILDRTNMIGVLKSLGASNWTVRKIFLYNAMNLVLKGLIIGNAVGLGLIAIQYYFSPLTLDPQSYHVTEMPVYISLWHVLALNLGTFAVCLLALIIPTLIVSKISPVKAMRFE